MGLSPKNIQRAFGNYAGYLGQKSTVQRDATVGQKSFLGKPTSAAKLSLKMFK